MNQIVNTMEPTVSAVVDNIKNIIKRSIQNIENNYSDLKILTSYIEGTSLLDSWTFSISFALDTEAYNDKTLNFIIAQNIKSREICVVITTGEKEGFKILYKAINKYPISGIEKYLPNIIESSINILTNNK